MLIHDLLDRTKHRSAAKRPCGRRGAAAVEFAIVAPVFILLLFGMIEYGRMIMVQQIITNAAREGARRAVLDGAVASTVATDVRLYLDRASIRATGHAVVKVNVTPNPLPAPGEEVTVEIQMPYDHASWMPTPFLVGGKQLGARAIMRRE